MFEPPCVVCVGFSQFICRTNVQFLDVIHIMFDQNPYGSPFFLLFSWPQGYGHIPGRTDIGGGSTPTFDYELIDRVKVPTDKGDWLLSWRWDTEQKSQVWAGCADIEIV